MKRILILALTATITAAAATLQAEDKKDAPVYDPMTWKADTIQGVAGYVVPTSVKGRRGKKQETTQFLPMRNLATGQVLGKLQPVSISDYSRGWTYVEEVPASTSMADNSQPGKSDKK